MITEFWLTYFFSFFHHFKAVVPLYWVDLFGFWPSFFLMRKKSVIIFIISPFIFLHLIPWFSLYLWFYPFSGFDFLFIFGIHWVCYMLYQIWEDFGHYFLKYIFFLFCLSSPLKLLLHMWEYLIWSHRLWTFSFSHVSLYFLVG